MLVLLNGIFKRARKVWKLPVNPAADIERLRVLKRPGIEFYSPEEVHALACCAGSTQDGARSMKLRMMLMMAKIVLKTR